MEKLNDFFLGLPCHRKKERCLHIKGVQMMLCSRCFAIYISYLFLPLFFLIPYHFNYFFISILLLFPLIIDGYTQKFGWRLSNNKLRIFTGFLFTSAQCLFIKNFIQFLILNYQ